MTNDSRLEREHGKKRQEGPLRSGCVDDQGAGPQQQEREAGGKDLESGEHDSPRVRGPHLCRAQWEQVRPGVRHGEHGRPQARRVRAHPALPGPQREDRGRQKGQAGVIMSGHAIQRLVRQSPRKMRLVIDLIRGKDVNEAYAILKFNKKLAAKQIAKTLKSAVSNAEQKALKENESFDPDALFVRKAIVNGGQPLKRFTAAAQGRATPIKKPPSHVEIYVDSKETE